MQVPLPRDAMCTPQEVLLWCQAFIMTALTCGWSVREVGQFFVTVADTGRGPAFLLALDEALMAERGVPESGSWTGTLGVAMQSLLPGVLVPLGGQEHTFSVTAFRMNLKAVFAKTAPVMVEPVVLTTSVATPLGFVVEREGSVTRELVLRQDGPVGRVVSGRMKLVELDLGPVAGVFRLRWEDVQVGLHGTVSRLGRTLLLTVRDGEVQVVRADGALLPAPLERVVALDVLTNAPTVVREQAQALLGVRLPERV